MRHVSRCCVIAFAVLALAGCGGSGAPVVPTIQAARTFKLVNFQPTGPVTPGKPVTVSFEIQKPDGSTMKTFKTGPGPHTGVHMIFVRDDLSTIIHHHPPLNGTGKIVDHVTFAAPGPYRLEIDIYPATCASSPTPSIPQAPGAPTAACNFQLTGTIHVAGAYKPQPLPPTVHAETVDGYHFTLGNASNLRAIQAQLVQVHVTTLQGKPAVFQTCSARLRTRSSSAAARSTISTHTCVQQAPLVARVSSAQRKSPVGRRRQAS